MESREMAGDPRIEPAEASEDGDVAPGSTPTALTSAMAEIRRLEETILALQGELESRRQEVATLQSLLRQVGARRPAPPAATKRMGTPRRHVRTRGAAQGTPDPDQAARRALHQMAHGLEKQRPWWWLPHWGKPR